MRSRNSSPLTAAPALLRLLRAAATLLLALAVSPIFARSAPPILRLPLEPLDFQPFPAQVLGSGASLATLHYVDATHLLLTFNRRRLMARIPGDPDTDVDRNIDAVLLELPSGKLLARTAWRLHDPGQYLWSLSNGAFLLRSRDRLTTFSPLANLATGEPFKESPLLQSHRSIGAVLLSPEADLITLETLDHSPYAPRQRSPSPGTHAYAAAAAAGSAGDAAAETSGPPVQIDFFRLGRHADTGTPFAVRAGVINARNLVLLPIDSAGFLTVLDQGQAHWAFDFNRHTGKTDELSPFDSTCHPLPLFVSRSEFIAFGCHGGQEKRQLGGFNLRGEEMWEQSFTDSYTAPSLAFAPASGRFALSRLITPFADAQVELAESAPVSQNITVYQTESGRQLFTLTCNPPLRAAQNFALSPTGEQIAILNQGAIEFYQLPGMTGRDREALKLAESLAPEREDAPIHLDVPLTRGTANAAFHTSTNPAPEPTRPIAVTDAATILPATATAPAPTPEPAATQLGDAPPEASLHRRPPTLYAPGEAPAKTEDKK